MAKNAGISARISGDPKPLKQALDTSVVDTQAWVNKMVGINGSLQKSYSSLAFGGPQGRRMPSPIAQMADEDAKAWARRMADTTKHSAAWGRQMSGGAGMAALQTAQAVDDLQYGIKGVLNNIPGLVMSLGGGAGLAGVLSLVAVGAATVGKAFVNWWTDASKLKEVKTWVEELDAKLKGVASGTASDALTGTAEGAKALATAMEKANASLAEQQAGLSKAAQQAKELIAVEAELAAAKQGGNSPGGVKAEQAIQVEQAKALHRVTLEQMRAEHAAAGERAIALDAYAKQVEEAAAVARTKANGLEPGANSFVAETTVNAAAAAEKDAALARAAADKAHNDSLKEQQRISDEINQAQLMHARELELLWIRTDERVKGAEQTAREKDAAEKQARAAAAASAEEAVAMEEKVTRTAEKRRLEEERDGLEKKIKEREGQTSVEAGVSRAGGGERSRRINARARPARAGFGVSDVQAYQGLSLRGQMDANIGPVGQRRPTAATDRQAHEMKVQQANQGGDPLLTALKAVEKRLEAIQQNTDGMAKGKSEPLRRQ